MSRHSRDRPRDDTHDGLRRGAPRPSRRVPSALTPAVFALALPLSGTGCAPCGTGRDCKIVDGSHRLRIPVRLLAGRVAHLQPRVRLPTPLRRSLTHVRRRDHNRCDPEAEEVVESGAPTCTRWTDRKGGSEVGLCLHDGEYERFEGWLDRELEWMLSLHDETAGRW